MDATPLLLAIIGHLVGDYLLQNDWMALNKKKPGIEGLLACMIHAMLWTASVCAFAGWWPFGTVHLAWSFLMIAHFVQDRTGVVVWWMTRVNRQAKFVSGPCAPWSVIVVDNVWHIVSLWAVWRFLDLYQNSGPIAGIPAI
jgi:hypothetical protein